MACVPTTITFDPAKTAAAAALFNVTAGPDGDQVLVDGGESPSETIAVWTVDIPQPGCEVVSVLVDATFTRDLSTGDPAQLGEFGGAVFVGDVATLTPFGSITSPSGDSGVLAPGVVSRGNETAGGTAIPDPASLPIGGTWTGTGTFDILVALDADADAATAGTTVGITKPTVCVEYAPGSECAETPEPAACSVTSAGFDPVATADFAAAVSALFGLPHTAAADGASVTAGAGENVVGAWRLTLADSCLASVVSVQAASTVSVTPEFDDAEDGVVLNVLHDVTAPITSIGTLAPTTGGTGGVFPPGALFGGYTSDPSGVALPATLDGTWQQETTPGEIWVVAIVDGSVNTDPAAQITAAPPVVCVEYSSELCPPRGVPYCFDLAATGAGCVPQLFG